MPVYTDGEVGEPNPLFYTEDDGRTGEVRGTQGETNFNSPQKAITHLSG